MKRSTKLLSSVLALATVVSAGSCGGGGGGRTVQSDANGEVTTAATSETLGEFTTYETDEELQGAVANVEISEEIKAPEKKITWLSWWGIDETGATSELFKAKFGVPEEGNQKYGDEANNIFVFRQCSYAARYDTLGTMVSSGDSPDMFPFEIEMFPLSAYKGMFQSIDGIIDTYSEEWSNTRADMDKFMWGGKNYAPIVSVGPNGLWYYRKTVIEEAGLKDPYELYLNNEWDWNAMLEMADMFQKTGDNKACTDGWRVARSLVCTTGVPLVSIENGLLVSNLNSPSIERCMDVISTMAKQGYAYDLSANSWSTNPKAWANGDTLFMVEGPWYYYETLVKMGKKYGFEPDDIFFVPAPRDPNADEYYQELKTDPFMLVAGAQNVDGYKAWMSCEIAVSRDPDVSAAAREKDKRDRFWTDEQLDFMDEIGKSGKLKAVFDFRNGISTSCADTTSGQAPTDKLINDPYKFPDDTYVNLRAQFEGEINSAIDELNATVS